MKVKTVFRKFPDGETVKPGLVVSANIVLVYKDHKHVSDNFLSKIIE